MCTCMSDGVMKYTCFWSHDLTSIPPVLPQEPFDAADTAGVTPDCLKVKVIQINITLHRLATKCSNVNHRMGDQYTRADQPN